MTPNEIDPIANLRRQKLILEMLGIILSNQLMGVPLRSDTDFFSQQKLACECAVETERLHETITRLVNGAAGM